MSLALFSETDPPGAEASLTRRTVEVQFSRGEAIVHEHGRYRLTMSATDFAELRAQLKRTFEDRHWAWLLQRYRNFKGDV